MLFLLVCVFEENAGEWYVCRPNLCAAHLEFSGLAYLAGPS